MKKKNVESLGNNKVSVDISIAKLGYKNIGFSYINSDNITRSILIEAKVPTEEVIINDDFIFPGKVAYGHNHSDYYDRYSPGPNGTNTIWIPKMEISKDDFFCSCRSSTKYNRTNQPDNNSEEYMPAPIQTSPLYIYPTEGVIMYADKNYEGGVPLEDRDSVYYGIMTDKATKKYLGSHIMISAGKGVVDEVSEWADRYEFFYGSIVSESDEVSDPTIFQFGSGNKGAGLAEIISNDKYVEIPNKDNKLRYNDANIAVHVKVTIPKPLPHYIIKSIDEFNELIPRLLSDNDNDLSKFTIAIMDNDRTNSNPYRFPNSIIKTPGRVIKQNGNYTSMFENCTNLKWVSPAIIWRYQNLTNMFKGCTGITSELPRYVNNITGIKNDLNWSWDSTEGSSPTRGGHFALGFIITDCYRGCINVANKEELEALIV